MIAIKLSFPTGKLHATPWGRQVNEGAVEWPPSPWRLLRALIAVWYNKLPDVPREDVEPIIDALTDPPSFRLPTRLSQGHTRHYMPTNSNAAKIFDTFMVIPRDEPVVVCWTGANLSEDRRQLLRQMLQAMAYFGRAESWVDAELLGEFTDTPNAVPLPATGVQKGETLERLLATDRAEDFHVWREEFVATKEKSALSEKLRKAKEKGKDTSKVKLTPKEKQKITSQVPDTLFDALHAETNSLRKNGWNRPPGSRWVEYVRPADTVATRPISRATRKSKLPTVARYAVTGKVVPRLTQALRIGERARKVIMGCSKRVRADKNAASVFSGKATDGSPLQTSHQHAHFLCEANDGTGKITHLSVCAPQGFEESDERALSRFTRTWGDAGHDLQFVLLGIGQPENFGGHEIKAGQSPVLATSTNWISRTPYVPSRHLKLKRSEQNDPQALADALESSIHRELTNRGLIKDPDDVTVEAMLNPIEAGTEPWLKFARHRQKGGGSSAGSRGYGFRLNFANEIPGPIALGYGCHFGLGQFIAVDEEAK